VTRLCGRLPLALRIAGQLLAAHPAWPVARLAQVLAGERDRLARLGAGDLQVRAAFGVSYAQLAEEDARLFRLLGLHPGPDFTASSAAALAGTEDEVAGSALDRLAGAHLVTEDAAGRFGMHDLLRLFARATSQDTDSPADREAAEARLVSYYVDLAGFFESCVDPELRREAEQAGGRLPPMKEALAMFQDERPILLATVGLAEQRGWDEQVGRLSQGMGDSLAVLHYSDDQLTVREAELAAARHAGDLRAEGMALTSLGIAHAVLERWEEAVDYYQQSLAILRETGDRRFEGMALTNLGNAYRELGRLEEAIDCYRQGMAICLETGDAHGGGQTLNNLGIAYQDLGRLEKAIECHQHSHAICRELGDRYGEGRSLNNLGIAYRDLGRLEEGIDCYQQSLAIRRETGDRHGEGQTLNNLGNAYQELGQPRRAAEYRREAAAVMRDVGDHEEAARLEHQAAGVQFQPRHRWSLRRRPPS
jgi:tetratricopeptide (TPR) repeat protein